MSKHHLLPLTVLVVLVALTACQADSATVAQNQTTATLAPIVSLTPRLTATPVPTRTPIPTSTEVPPTPTDTVMPSDTPTPTEEPPVVGVVNSLERVNVRTGPGITYADFAALEPGTGVEILGQSSDGNWLNVKLEDDQEGWMAARLLRIQPTPTSFPTFTPTVDLTAVALGTIPPTSIVGGAAITPTPPPILATVQSPTPVATESGELVNDDTTDTTEEAGIAVASSASETPTITGTPREAGIESTPVLLTNTPTITSTPRSPLAADESVLPVIDIDAIHATATALSERGAVAPVTDAPQTPATAAAEAGLAVSVTPIQGGIFDDPDDSVTDPDERTVDIDTTQAAIVITEEAASGAAASEDATENPSAVTGTPRPTSAASSGAATVQAGVDVLAYCDDPGFGTPPPDDLKAGSTIDIYWIWYASTEQYIRDHLNSAVYEVSVNGDPLTNLPQYRQPIQNFGGDFAESWFVPYGPLEAGEYTITYRVSWSQQIFDGYQFFGPGSNTPSEEGTCTFTVAE